MTGTRRSGSIGAKVNCPCKRLVGTYNSPIPAGFRIVEPGTELLGSARLCDAGVAQLAEHDVANVVVVGSNPITRSLVLSPELTAFTHDC